MQKIEAAMKTIGVTSLAFGLIMVAIGSSLLSIWIAAITVQLVAHMALMNLMFPSLVYRTLLNTL